MRRDRSSSRNGTGEEWDLSKEQKVMKHTGAGRVQVVESLPKARTVTWDC